MNKDWKEELDKVNKAEGERLKNYIENLIKEKQIETIKGIARKIVGEIADRIEEDGSGMSRDDVQILEQFLKELIKEIENE